MISFYLLWTGCYLVSLSWLAKKWPNSIKKPDFDEVLPSVTLLIPFRNEQENLEILIPEIHKIGYTNLAIMLIDDQSEDGSFSLLKEKMGNDSKIKILKSPGIGKKTAIEYGVHLAETELILCTDADCTFPAQWIRNMVAPFRDEKVQLVAGPVISQMQETFFQRFQQIEWSSILLMTQFFFHQKNPLMCSGANLAYRKSAFLEVSGYSQNRHHLSGDDEFLLKKITSHFGKDSCVYLPFPETLVFTTAQENPAALINQRVRWAGKWKMHQDPLHALAAVFSFVIQLVWIASFMLLGSGFLGVLCLSMVWTGKALAEKFALGKVLKCLGISSFTFDFIKTSLVHPFYVAWVAMGSLRGKFVWKGRTN